MSAAPVTSDRLTMAEVAHVLGCSRWKAQQLVGREIPSVKIGRAWQTRLRDVEAYQRKHEFGPDRPKPPQPKRRKP